MDAAKTPPSMEDFFTVDLANEGVILPLAFRWGEKSDAWLRVLGRDSDKFRKAKLARDRADMAIMSAKDAEGLTPEQAAEAKAAALEEEEHKLAATLVSAWSFPQECTRDAVIAFFKKAPQIREQVDRLAGSRSLFFAKPATTSAGSPSANSDLTSESREAPKPSESA